MGCIALVRCVLVLRCGLACGVVSGCRLSLHLAHVRGVIHDSERPEYIVDP